MNAAAMDTAVNPRLIGARILRYWYLFAIGLVVALAWAYWHLRSTVPRYEVEAQVLIKEEKSYGEDLLFA